MRRNEWVERNEEDRAMLKIIFGDVENAVYHPPTYFDNRYEDEWITAPLSVAMIKDIDKRSEERGVGKECRSR